MTMQITTKQKSLPGLETLAPASPGWRARIVSRKTTRFPSISCETQDEIKRLYLEEQLSSLQIAKTLAIRLRLVTYAIAKMGIARSFEEAALVTKEHGYSPVRGKWSHAWKGGSHKQGGYVYVYAPNHPRVKRSKDVRRRYVAEHILVWEQVHQRRLPDNWIVHHLNGIKTDNRPENLVAYPKKKHDQLIPEMAKRIRTVELENELLKKALANQQALFVINEN